MAQAARGRASMFGPPRPAAAALRREVAEPRLQRAARLLRRASGEPWVLVFGGCLLLVIALYALYAAHGITLNYADGRSKLNMARRVWDDIDPGFGQVGGIWLPLPTLLMALTAWCDPLYYSGFSGALWSILAFAGSGAFLFLLGRRMTRHWAGGAVAVLLLVANPNALYLATTPMAESILICGIAAVVYFLDRVEERPREQNRVFWLSVAVLLLSLSRYEGWFLLGAVVVALAAIFLRDGQPFAETQARLIAFLVIAAMGIVFWLIWETLIFHDPLFFSHSKYSAHAIDVVAFGIDQSVGNLSVALSTYWQAMTANIPLWQIALAGAGLAVYLARELRRPRTARIAPLVLLAVPAYFVVTLYLGQGAIDMRSAPYYNVRYGTIALPLIAAFAAYGATVLLPRLLKPAAAVGALLLVCTAAPTLAAHNAVVLSDRGAQTDATRLSVITYLKQNYDGGRLLIETFKNNDISFNAQIAQSNLVTEGNPELYKAALLRPELFVEWIYAGKNELSGSGDSVAIALGQDPALLDSYDVVLDNGAATLYRLKAPLLPALTPTRALQSSASDVIKHAPYYRTSSLGLDDCGPQSTFQTALRRSQTCVQ
jgi:hypothetical protein